MIHLSYKPQLTCTNTCYKNRCTNKITKQFIEDTKKQKFSYIKLSTFNLNFKMDSCFYFVLVLCLVIPEPSYSQTSFGPIHSLFTRVLGLLGYRKSTSSSEGYQSQEDSDGNVLLSRFLSNPNLRGTADKCQEKQSPSCDPNTPYRTYDGTCNNLQNPTWGSVDDCLVRVLPPAYEGPSGMRRAVDGSLLPSPRDLSLNIFLNKTKLTPNVTLMFTAFGQIAAHDMSLSTPPVGSDLTRDPGIHCCPVSKAESPDCSAIEIRKDDPFYSKRNITCIEFMRGLQCTSCKDNGKMQISNLVPCGLDVNIVYGTSKDDAEKMRTKDGTGRLKARYTKSGEMLLENTDPNLTFCPVMETSSCFMAGDPRVNQHTYLASLQTILAREHNRMATHLKVINPHWDDEKIYQTGRKLLGAKLQAIVFNEYAPVLLGQDYMTKFKLWVKNEGESTEYDPNLRFGTWPEYGSGAFRAHSMIPAHTGYGTNLFRDMYSNNHPILDGRMSEVISGSCKVKSQQFGHFIVPDIADFLYKQPHENYGIDMVAIDIHRGRDHGLPPYIQVLNYCDPRNRNITEFDQLREVMPQEHIDLLKKNYGSVHDVDMYVGIHLEDIMAGSVLSPTAACIVGGQLHFTKFGDRYYFEHTKEAPSFTVAQRESLKKTSLSRMICDNVKEITDMLKNPFLIESDTNPVLPCGQHPEVDLTLWKSLE